MAAHATLAGYANPWGLRPVSQLLIGQYLNELADLRRVSGTTRETVVREAFKSLLKAWGRSHELILITEHEHITPTKDRRLIDGALLHQLRVPHGYWEAKDEKDNLDDEIEIKFRRGYPQDNIIFEDSRTAVLIQNRQEVMRCDVENGEALERLLSLFFGYARPEIAEFRNAVEQFKTDLPAVLSALRDMIDKAEKNNPAFGKAAVRFLKHAQETINPAVTAADVREMLIQHILTEEIFSQVFDNADFHRKNNVAKELYALEETFFTGSLKHKTLDGLRSYYAAIRSAAALVTSHLEKQKFLKTIYENFYKVYDKKKADRLGVVYTPNEIVRFMVESADWLCQRHFGRQLIDKNVEILDPAAGTGTFIVELLEHFRGRPRELRYKYLEELHANEVAILPYYVANLNIEATYAAITGEFEEYPNLCFVDTLDNVAALRVLKGQHYGDLLGGVSEENVERIRRQNKKKISVIIGNPPYNANQQNENENNKNREYPQIDERIRATYIAKSAAHKTKLYDMYARFYRWASDRLTENGVIAFVSNRSFFDSRTFDGFRKVIAEEFNEVWIVDLGGDVRSNPKISGTKHNVFGIQTGVAITFLVKKGKSKECVVRYARRPEMETADEKLSVLSNEKLSSLHFEETHNAQDGKWLKSEQSDFDGFIPLALRKLSGKIAGDTNSIFSLYSYGVISQRDQWVFDVDRKNLERKVQYYIDTFNSVQRSLPRPLPKDWEKRIDYSIKWPQDARKYLERGDTLKKDEGAIVSAAYRPFSNRYYYYSKELNWSLCQIPSIFPIGLSNIAISFSDVGRRAEFMALAVDRPADLHFGASIDAYQQASRFRFGSDGTRIDNITDWSLEQFSRHYEKGKKPKRSITKDAIFHYVYGVLHDPAYREKYALNLKREFPRIPFYADFWRWAEWGEKLMQLHIGYEKVEPWRFKRTDAKDEKSRKAGLAPKVMLKVNKDAGNIQLDSETQLTGIPVEAWDYKLGNRSALEWILDQYKEKTPKDPTIREKFNTYKFADHKEKVIDLLMRVTRVSVETMKIIEAMRQGKR